MKKLILIPLLLSISLYANSEMSDEGSNNSRNSTQTDSGVSEKVEDDDSVADPIVDGTDKYGNSAYERVVKINTPSYKVENFWSKISLNGKGQQYSSTVDVATQGRVRITVEATSLCSLYPELDEEGCSGQKPFFINYEAIENKVDGDEITLLFQKDYNGTDILYNPNANELFFPLDVGRKGIYYEDQGEAESSTCKSFFCVIGKMFNSFFGDGFFSSWSNQDVVKSNNGDEGKVIKQRYVANITSGIDQEHLLTKNDTIDITKAGLNDPLSLIDYIEKTETVGTSGSCSFFFFKFPVDSLFCNFPFVKTTSTVDPITYTVDTIQTDTEKALVAFAGAYSDINVTEYELGMETYTEATISAPRQSFLDRIKCFFFFCPDPVTPPAEIAPPIDTYYTFDDDKAIFLTMAVSRTASANIDNFQTFRLKSIHSITGNERMCRVTNDFDDSVDGWSDYTFKATEDTNKIFVTSASSIRYYCHSFIRSDYDRVEGESCSFGYSEEEETVITLTPEDHSTSWWLDWCDDAKIFGTDETVYEEQCTGLFFFRQCEDVAVSTKLIYQDYTVKQYVNSGKRGLSLDLELVTLKPTDEATTIRYKIMDVK